MNNSKLSISRVLLLVFSLILLLGSSFILYSFKNNTVVLDQEKINNSKKLEIKGLQQKIDDLSAKNSIDQIEQDDINIDNSVSDVKALFDKYLVMIYSLNKISDGEKKELKDQFGLEVADKLIYFNNNDGATSGQQNTDKPVGERAELIDFTVGSGDYDYISNTMPIFLNVNYQSSTYDATPSGGSESRERKLIKHKSNDFYTMTYNLKEKTWKLNSVQQGDTENVEVSE